MKNRGYGPNISPPPKKKKTPEENKKIGIEEALRPGHAGLDNENKNDFFVLVIGACVTGPLPVTLLGYFAIPKK